MAHSLIQKDSKSSGFTERQELDLSGGVRRKMRGGVKRMRSSIGAGIVREAQRGEEMPDLAGKENL